MKVTKSKLKKIINEEMSSLLNEVKILKQGFFKKADSIEWEIFDNGKICFETHHGEDYSPSSICVPLDELKQILASTSEPRPDRNEYMWDQTAKAFPEEYEGTENPFRTPPASSESAWELKRKLDLGKR